MAHGVNKVTLLGNLGADPKIHSTDKNKVATLSLATTEIYKDKTGEWVKQTQWHYVTLFNRLAEIARDHLQKKPKSISKVVLKHKSGKINKVTNRQRSPLLPMSYRCYQKVRINLQILKLTFKKILMMIFLFRYY